MQRILTSKPQPMARKDVSLVLSSPKFIPTISGEHQFLVLAERGQVHSTRLHLLCPLLFRVRGNSHKGLLKNSTQKVIVVEVQAERVLAAVATAAQEGCWLYLPNAHLMASFLPTLEKTVLGLEALNPHRDFRLWISTAPCADFPAGLLQASYKFAVEPPQVRVGEAGTCKIADQLLLSREGRGVCDTLTINPGSPQASMFCRAWRETSEGGIFLGNYYKQ